CMMREQREMYALLADRPRRGMPMLSAKRELDGFSDESECDCVSEIVDTTGSGDANDDSVSTGTLLSTDVGVEELWASATGGGVLGVDETETETGVAGGVMLMSCALPSSSCSSLTVTVRILLLLLKGMDDNESPDPAGGSGEPCSGEAKTYESPTRGSVDSGLNGDRRRVLVDRVERSVDVDGRRRELR
ncbi:hypothetical protein H0H87_001355, partial [Tephrocybe sp. NHM501043]